jgi:hypothetical protein
MERQTGQRDIGPRPPSEKCRRVWRVRCHRHTAGGDDAWSSYWYNNLIYVNGGLGSRDIRGDRGLDVYKLLRREKQQFTIKSFQHFNPQTQEDFERLGG